MLSQGGKGKLLYIKGQEDIILARAHGWRLSVQEPS